MKRRLMYISIIALSIISFSCTKEDEIKLEPFKYVEEAIDTSTTLGQKIKGFHDKYESLIYYNWDLRFLGNDASAVPPYYDKVSGFIDFLEEVWLAPYHDEEFLKKNLPREIILVGGSINYGEDNGSSFGAAGQADSQYRINIGQVNDYSDDMDVVDYFYYHNDLEKVLHHEFAHILCRRYGLPDAYVEISKGLYLKNTHHSSLSFETALERGFIRPYGASNEMEDFATLVEIVTTRSEENVMHGLFLKPNAAGDGYDTIGLADYEMLYKKYKLIVKFYNEIGIDVQRIGNESEAWRQAYVESLQNSATAYQPIIITK